ncbi:MAG TPA: O-antigen ligase family protein [Solirubrobacteraceae bacterium]|jgi:O-antigen ligase|nr:O-antigen ligase family protein [Solirubrobacteraceae bacterium]
MTAKLTASLRAAPATVPCLAALALCVVWATDQAGYPVTHWAPGGLILLVLLAIAVAIVRGALRGVPAPVRVALACMAAFTAFSYLSILWAGAPGEALEGADRTLLYLLVFALFAAWPQRALPAAGLLLVWTLSLTGLAVFVVVHLAGASQSGLQALLPGGRLVFPSGYANANAAEWLMAMWPAFLLARERRLPWALRGLLAGAAVLLAEVALLSQSRGSLFATPVMLVLVFALLPGRTRTFALLLPVAGGIAAAAPAALRVGDHLRDGQVVRATLHSAISAALLAALVVAVVVAVAAALESRRVLPEPSARRVHRVTGAVALAALIVVIAGGLVAAGNPIHRVEHAWHSFKGGYGEGGGDRLLSGLGSNRYDFYRVAVDEFSAHPLAGIGADNFQQQYLRHGTSEETPRYPHSVELRTLSQTGLIGALLALAGLGAAMLAAWRALRGPDPLARAVAAAALAGFGYWVVHGSVDWFWEFAGLGAPAFALLGLVCALTPLRGRVATRPSTGEAEAPERDAGASEREAAPANGPADSASQPARRRLPIPRPVLPILGLLVASAGALALAGPWLSQLQLQRAARIWPQAPASAYSRLDQAAKLDPLSEQPYLVAGSIALRRDEVSKADGYFAKALGRVPDDAYATLERGAIASGRGERAAAERLLRRAAELNPRDSLTRQALEIERRGGTVSVEGLNRAILTKAEELA